MASQSSCSIVLTSDTDSENKVACKLWKGLNPPTTGDGNGIHIFKHIINYISQRTKENDNSNNNTSQSTTTLPRTSFRRKTKHTQKSSHMRPASSATEFLDSLKPLYVNYDSTEATRIAAELATTKPNATSLLRINSNTNDSNNENK